MARIGIQRENVEHARQALLARGASVSIDAIRAELGNTGSKTTIHRHLKAIEQTETDKISRPSLSEELTQLIEGVAQRIAKEADDKIEGLLQTHQEEVRSLRNKMESLAQENKEYCDLNATLQEVVTAKKSDNATLTDKLLKSEQALKHAEQDMISRDKEIALLSSHNASLEAKHNDARDALSHYRDSIKHQREQEQSHYEEQIAQLRQSLRDSQLLVTQKQDLLASAQSNLAEVSTAMSHLKRLHMNTEDALKALQKKYDHLSKEYNEARNKHIVLSETHHRTLAQMQSTVDSQQEAEKQLVALSKENQKLIGQIESQQSIITKWLNDKTRASE